LADEHSVHPVWAGAEFAAQPGSAKGEASGKTAFEADSVVAIDQSR
jgi:hypothetical protein